MVQKTWKSQVTVRKHKALGCAIIFFADRTVRKAAASNFFGNVSVVGRLTAECVVRCREAMLDTKEVRIAGIHVQIKVHKKD